MPFVYLRTVKFQDTDAAGVVYFANVLNFCHEAYEASLAETDIDLQDFFRGTKAAVPIAHARVDFLRPLYCGDRLAIHLTAQHRDSSAFRVDYQIYKMTDSEQLVSRAVTEHIYLKNDRRTRTSLSLELRNWVQRWNPNQES
ncbi:MAG: acyl-CoA thioesterase [Aphanocapsa sp. GSE-SYN-MK-11-07L]|jgi:1,4-dihydroxy-2-naphthoyl-CoA hydrolase|nr:acyl-CoA thioesterase [Aphanocapsa sp. GSE-SYN-MK-11-07L]